MINQVARRYAEALFELAEENDILSDMYTEIFDLKNIIKENNGLYDVLRSPFVKNDEKKQVIDAIFGGQVSEYGLNFLKVLVDNQRITELEGIVAAYRGLFKIGRASCRERV